MAFGVRAALRPIVVLFVALLSANASGADARETKGIPKSAPAFTKFAGVVVDKTLESTLPGAKVTVEGRLRLGVILPGGDLHTMDLHNLYSVCQRAPDRCEDEVVNFVSDAAYAYKHGDAGRSQKTLRIAVRPSAYVTTLRANPKRNKPIAMPLAGDYWAIAVDDRPTSIAMLDESDLAKLNLLPKEAMMIAVANTLEAYQTSIQKELSTDCHGILNGDDYTASTALFIDDWQKLARRCRGDVYIAIPAADVVLYTDGTNPGGLKGFVDYANQIVSRAEKPFSSAILRLTDKGWVPVPPPK